MHNLLPVFGVRYVALAQTAEKHSHFFLVASRAAKCTEITVSFGNSLCLA